MLSMGPPGQASRVQTLCIESLGHEFGMLDAGAKTYAADFSKIGLVVFEGGNDSPKSLVSDGMASGIDIGKFGFIESALGPKFVGIQRDRVFDDEVVEWNEKLLIKGFGEPDFSGEAVMEFRNDATSVHALGRCSEGQKQLRFEFFG